MGCDIHLYIEHKYPTSTYWSGFGGRINPGRDYRMFSRLAGVRSYGDEVAPISEPRGLPSDLDYRARSDNHLFIVDTEEPGENEATRKDAERWVKDGVSRFDGKDWVTHPDWHSHSWLTAHEFASCVESPADVDSDYKAIVAVLRCFESLGEQARVVFWFDN